MDMFDGVGRRRDQKSGQLVNIGEHTLNGFERDYLLRNNGEGTFTDVAYVNQADRIEDGRGVAVFDYDLDGQVDVVLRNYRQPAQLLRNRGGSGHWVEIKLIGTRSNRDAVGARITLTAGGEQQTREIHAGSAYLSGSSLVQHFGLGDHTRIDSVRIRWPSGLETTLTHLEADQQLMLREGDAAAVAVTRWKYPADAQIGSAR
jgi:enediyne biosynthesis protein E4